VDQEDGLELADLGHIKLGKPPRPDDASSDSLPSANILARYGCSDSHLRSADRIGDQFLRFDSCPNRLASRGDDDSDSRHDNNSRSREVLHAGPSSYQYHVLAGTNNYHTFEDPRSNALESLGELASVALPITRSNQRNRHHSPFQSINEAPSYTGKDKGCMLDVDREPDNNENKQREARRPLWTSQRDFPAVHEKGEVEFSRNGIPFLPKDYAMTPFLNDLEFERRRYRQKKLQRFRLNPHEFCTAVKSENCRVHSKLVRNAETLAQNQDTSRIGTSQGAVGETSRFDESAALCGTVYEQSRLVEEAGVAAEWRRRDENTLRCVDGWWVIVVVLLDLAAVVGFLVENA
jgi:hypothetical protein